jgi:hypothetical protein
MNMLGNLNGLNNDLGYFAVGQGTVAEAATDTTLGSELARTNNNGGVADISSYTGTSYSSFIRTRIFTQAQANGNLTEIGIFNASSGGSMYCRQLIKDETGTPTTITKTSEFELRVSYELRWYLPTDSDYNILVDGISRAVRSRPAYFGFGWKPQGGFDQSAGGTTGIISSFLCLGPLVAITDIPASDAQQNGFNQTTGHEPYVAGSYQLLVHSRWGSTIANGKNYQTILTGFGGQRNLVFQHQLLDGFTITKNSTQRFDIDHKVTWARYTP